jgi:alkylation response protein AidB-like acyl-CoA dehydrogenase
MEDHDLIARSARDVLEREFARGALHACFDGSEAEARQLWDLAVRMGWPGASVPEELGGLGLDARAAVALLKEYGRAAVPAELFSATVAALWSSLRTADDQIMRDVATLLGRGELRPLIPGLDWSTVLELDDDRVSGQLPGMIGGHGCDSAILPARRGGTELMIVLPLDGGSCMFTRDDAWDRSRSLGTLACEKAVPTAIIADHGRADFQRLGTVLRLALAADSVGGIERLLDMTTAYARMREQFGRPVGSFQAIKHRLATMHIELQPAMRLLELATDAFVRGDENAALWATIAKAEACDTYVKAVEESVLLHGGVGFTWEFDCHIYLKRARLNAFLAGNGRSNRDNAWQALVEASREGRSTVEFAA